MDAVFAAALEEIALEGLPGCPLPKLWGLLQGVAVNSEFPLNGDGKQVVWQALVNVPGLVLLRPGPKLGGKECPQPDAVPASDAAFQNVEEVERLGLLVQAPATLRDACLGVYDLRQSDSQISDIQRGVLERLAKARYDGVTQNVIAKEFNRDNNAMFYVLKSLEMRGLLVRQSTIVRNKDVQPNRHGSIVATNLVHLTRFAKNVTLASHQRFEILKPSSRHEQGTDGGSEAVAGEESMISQTCIVNDDFPAMKNICEKLEAAAEKVLVVSDLKLSLGYRLAAGHRTWRRLVKRLQDAGLVESFNAQIDGKVVACLKLLKAFDAKSFYASNEEVDTDAVGPGKRGQVTEQLAELPIDHQIYDLIKNSGSEGLHLAEALKRLGLRNKRNYYRVTTMLAKQVVVTEAETVRKTTLYRLRTPEHAFDSTDPTSQGASTSLPHGRAQKFPAPSQEGASGKPVDSENHTSQLKGDTRPGLPAERQRAVRAAVLTSPNGDLQDGRLHEQKPAKRRRLAEGIDAGSVNKNIVVTSKTNAQRELRILKRLKAEGYILRVELHRWLEDIEDRNGTVMDRKTLGRLLHRLESRGACKSMKLSMPGLTNCGRKRESEVIISPDIEVTSDLVKQFHLSVRKFDAESRGQGICRTKNLTGVPVLTGVVTRMNQQKKPPLMGVDPLQGRSLKDNGFIPAKMVRVRMLHYFLWTYVNRCSETKDDLLLEKEEANGDSPANCNLPDKCNTFVLSAAVAAMPLELYLQIIGSTQNVERLPERCKQGMRMSDISSEELNAIVERTSGARLSWLVDILCRLQLVQLKMGKGQISCKHGPLGTTSTSLSYALELKPWIEEPATQALPTFSSDVFSMERHDFVLSKKEDLDVYWQTLEYVCSGADPGTGRRAFPGSKVPELFCVRSWTSIRIMSIEQRRELFERIGAGGPETRKSADECAKIARDLNLTVEQVLRVSYEKNRKVRLQALAQAAAESGTLPEASLSEDGKVLPRKRAGIESAVSEPAHVRAFKRQRRLLLDASTVTSPAAASQSDSKQAAARNVEEGNQLSQEEEEEEEEEDDVCGQGEAPGSCVAFLRPSRSRRFPWSDRLDRILIACYCKQRAILGARHHRVDWSKVPGLPAKPTLCRRRMALLRTDATVRSAISNLCSLLSARYLESLEVSRAGEGQREAQHLRRPITGSKSLGLVLSSEPATSRLEGAELEEDGSTQVSSCSSLAGTKQGQFSTWDNLEDLPVLRGLEEVMRCKIEARARRLSGAIGRGASKNKLGMLQRESSQKHSLENSDVDAPHIQAPASSFKPRCPSKIDNTALSVCARPGTGTGTRAVRSRARPRPVLKPLLSLPSTDEIVRSSLKVANCIELLKLILLNAGAMDRDPLVDALKRYKHGDVLTAFTFLRYHELVDVAHDKKQFILSPKFHHSCSASQFPSGTGEESLSTEAWLKEHGRALQSEWVTLSPEQTCGQLLQLFGLVAGGQFVLAPFLPDEGIGESEEYTNMVAGTKRKADSDGEHCSTKSRIQQHESHCLNLRRERGYPGITVSIHRASSVHLHEMIVRDVGNGTSDPVKNMDSQDLQGDSRSDKNISQEWCERSVPVLPESIPSGAQSMDSSQSLLDKCIDRWCSGFNGAYQTGASSLDPFMIKAVFRAIEHASDEGLSMDQLLLVIKPKGGYPDDTVTMEHAVAYVEALSSFELVQKVNAFDDVRLVSAQYAQQYMLHFKAPPVGVQVEVDGSSSMPESDTSQEGNPILPASSRNMLEGVSTVSVGEPEVVANSCTGVETGDPSTRKSKVIKDLVKETTQISPIRPWLTSDGALNTKFMKAMTRRVMGIVMLNPGITEDRLVENMGVLNPQNAKDFLHRLEAAGHVHLRTRLQAQTASPPHLLMTLMSSVVKKPLEANKTNRVKHYYPNPLDSKLL